MSSSCFPRMRADPEVGKIKRKSNFSVLVLPAPFGPSKPKTSPASTLRLSRSSARLTRLRQKPRRFFRQFDGFKGQHAQRTVSGRLHPSCGAVACRRHGPGTNIPDDNNSREV